MSGSAVRPKSSSSFRVDKNCPPDRYINILLLGQTGIGKTTFINSLANYLVNDTFQEAINDKLEVIIPTSFSFTDPETFEEKRINIGNETNHEPTNENGRSSTQQCRSFVFPLNDRNLRLIDTPGMGDTRGSEQDKKNLFEILTYISHYEHLNAICILLKPNEERLTIVFRLFIKQILHYLHSSASENIIFVFTNARSTLYTPGSSKKLLQTLLNDHREIPFSKENTFLLDNEP
jgi:predicted GTPase